MKRAGVAIVVLCFASLASAQMKPDATPKAAQSAAPDASATSPEASLASRQTLTLQQAVRIALEKNPTLQASEAYAEAVQKTIAEAKALRYPRLDFAEGFTRGNNPVYVFGTLLTQRQFSAGDFALNFLNAPLPIDNFQTSLTASMPLYDAGQTNRRVRDARLREQSAAEGRRRTQQEVVFRVISAYLNGLLAKQSVRVADSAVRMTRSDLQKAQARLQNGMAVASDALSAQVQLAQAEQNLLQAQNAVKLSQAALNVAMGLPEDSPTRIKGALQERTFQAGSLAPLETRALTMRPDYIQAELGRRRAANGSSMARAEFLPKIGLFGSWQNDNQTFTTRGGNNWLAGASLTFNIFNGGADRARLAEAKAREIQASASLSEVAATVRYQVREAYLNLETAGKRVRVSRDAVSQAEESLRILRNRYGQGLLTITDLLQAETARTRAQENYWNAVFDYRISYAALEMAAGELSSNSPAVTQ